MTKFEEEYKKRFKDDQSTDNVNVKNIWSNVSKQLDAQKVGIVNNRRRLSIILGLIGLFFIAGTSIWFNHDSSSDISSASIEANDNAIETSNTNSSSKNTEESKDLEMIDKNAEQKNIENSGSIEKKGSQNDNGSIQNDDQLRTSSGPLKEEKNKAQKVHDNKIDVLKASFTEQNEKKNVVHGSNSNDVTQGKIIPLSDHTGVLSEGKRDENRSSEESTISSQDSPNSNESINEKSPFSAKSAANIEDKEQTSMDHQVELKKLNLIIYSFEHTKDPLSIEKITMPCLPIYYDISPMAPSEISLTFGGVLLNNTYNSNSTALGPDIKDHLTNTTKKAWGYSTSLRATWKTNRIFRFSLGIDMDHFREIYDNVTTQQTTVNEDGHIIGLAVDSLGSVEPVFGTLEFDATETHTILHHNSYKMLTIPLEFGIEKKFNSLSLGLDAGVGYSMFLSQEGRTYNDEGVLEFFSKKDERLPLRTNGITYHFKSQIGYLINERVALRIEPSIRFLPTQNSPLQGIKRSSNAFSMKVGLAYKFK